jgi:hypothetical protein
MSAGAPVKNGKERVGDRCLADRDWTPALFEELLIPFKATVPSALSLGHEEVRLLLGGI